MKQVKTSNDYRTLSDAELKKAYLYELNKVHKMTVADCVVNEYYQVTEPIQTGSLRFLGYNADHKTYDFVGVYTKEKWSFSKHDNINILKLVNYVAKN